jgi:hypothetical protein
MTPVLPHAYDAELSSFCFAGRPVLATLSIQSIALLRVDVKARLSCF